MNPLSFMTKTGENDKFSPLHKSVKSVYYVMEGDPSLYMIF
ncbi:hypothetical protein BCI9360_01862 [Bacillus sp. CECT 9360]|nr:hypothetical protein BCI9360_01862 [Bacillus sp. CECT 9360]